MRVVPITCYRPEPSAAADFAALPYDVYDREEAAAYIARHPRSFLAIDRPDVAFSPDHDMYAPDVYEYAGTTIRERGTDGTLVKDQTPCFYLYRLKQGDHSQLGIVGACSVAEYEDGTIRRHEATHPDKTADRVSHIRACAAQTGPVLLAYPDSMAIDIIAGAAHAADPIYDFVDDQGVRQTIWRVARTAAVEALEVAFSTVPCAYIADGHHRASAAAQFAHDQRGQAGEDAGELASDFFLAVLFPASQLQVLPYNRVVADTCGLREADLLAAIDQAGFEVGEAQDEPFEPEVAGTFGLYAHGAWRSLRLRDGACAGGEGVASQLDASILQQLVLGPILGIDDPRTNKRISFVGGSVPASELERRAGTEGVAFTLFPTTVDQLMAVSDAGELMPPKSTWFEPKLLSGFFIRRV